MPFEEGQEFKVKAPFKWETVGLFDGEGAYSVMSWVPGFASGNNGYTDWMSCNGHGYVVYTIISYHKLPAPYPARVFYTRRFIDPDGKEFGKTKLRIMSVGHFRRLISQRLWPFSSEFDASLVELEEP